MYKVKLQFTEENARYFTFDNVNKAADFLSTCALSGFTATIEPNEENKTASELNEQQKKTEKDNYSFWIWFRYENGQGGEYPVNKEFLDILVNDLAKKSDKYKFKIESITHAEGVRRKLINYKMEDAERGLYNHE